MIRAYILKKSNIFLIGLFLISFALILSLFVSPKLVKADPASCIWQYQADQWVWVCDEPQSEAVEPTVVPPGEETSPAVTPPSCIWQWQYDHWVWTCASTEETTTEETTGNEVTTTTESTVTNSCIWQWQYNVWVWTCDTTQSEEVPPTVSPTSTSSTAPAASTCIWQWQYDHWVWSCGTVTEENNETQEAQIVVIKNVVNDDGGASVVEDFEYYLSNLSSETSEQVYSGVTTTIVAGDYQVSEEGETLSGYDIIFSGDCDDTGLVSVAEGETKICFITNDDVDTSTTTDEGENGEGGNGGNTGGDEGDTGVGMHNLEIFAEMAGDRTTFSVVINWQTNVPATSRVVWSTYSVTSTEGCPEGTATGTCLYGYEFSTAEDSTMVTSHSVTITGLNPSTIYYFRPISHASPEELGSEVMAETMAIPLGGSSGGSSSDGNNGGSSSGSGVDSGSSTSGDTTGGSSTGDQVGNTGGGDVEPEQGVLGEKISDEDPSGVGGAPQEVLGYSTLPEAGIDYTYYILSLAVAGMFFAGAAVVKSRGQSFYCHSD